MGSVLRARVFSVGPLEVFPERLELDYELDRNEAAPDAWRIWSFVATFTFQPDPFPVDAVARKSLSFRVGNPYMLTTLGVTGNWVSTPAEDAGSDLYLALFLGSRRRPLQSEPVNFSVIRGSGKTAAARTTWGLPLGEFPSFIHGSEPILVDVENRRPVPVGEVLTATVNIRGVRRYPR